METIKNAKFEIGNVYEMTFIGDSTVKVLYICTARSKKQVTFEKFMGKEFLRKKIRLDGDMNEYILYAEWSMAPSINSKRVIL